MGSATSPVPVVLRCGEVRTCLLPTSRPPTAEDTARLLSLRLGEPVQLSARPIRHALSPPLLTGVDCALPTADGTKIRAVGTVVSRASVTEGRVVQAGAFTSVPLLGPGSRRPWWHYLARPGVVEPLGKLPEPAVAQGFLTACGPEELDVGLIAEGLLTEVLGHPLLDHRPPLRTPRTRLRWVASRPADGTTAPAVRFTVAGDGLRTVELRLPAAIEPPVIAAFCADLALHDWLLTALTGLLDEAPPGGAPGEFLRTALRPAAGHLLHLWMPAARPDPRLLPLWEALERTPGFTRQWQSLAQRVRDLLVLYSLPGTGAPGGPRRTFRRPHQHRRRQ
ncbi:SCO2521 family protein [Streptomyces sp. SID4982]|uniref:SCO2521 family protein n=1 Tax=Streptomyces sp. SID4982 TaxID=2690291 RepID=UPI001F2DF75B|nr:SCO2521 family protein [Streptomyces sp. SID4982]